MNSLPNTSFEIEPIVEYLSAEQIIEVFKYLLLE